jgi:hypothetical protein
MSKAAKEQKAEFKYIPCECCQYPIAVPAQASSAVCIACPQCGHRACV